MESLGVDETKVNDFELEKVTSGSTGYEWVRIWRMVVFLETGETPTREEGITKLVDMIYERSGRHRVRCDN